MNWINVKRVIIVLLLIANAIAANSFFSELSSRRNVTDAAVQSAVEILSSDGIEISKDKIYKKLLSSPIYVYEKNVPYSLEFSKEFKTDYVHFANMVSFLTRGYSADESFIDTPDGVSVYMSAENFSANLNIKNDGSISYFSENASEAHSVADFATSKVSKENARVISSFFKSVYGTFGASQNYKALYEYEDGQDEYVVCVQVLEGYEYPEKTLEFCIRDGKIVSFSGFWCFDFKKAYSSKLYDSINVLFRLRGVAKSIEKISPVYCSVPYNEFENYAVPAFCVDFTDKEGNLQTAVFDALTLEQRQPLFEN